MTWNDDKKQGFRSLRRFVCLSLPKYKVFFLFCQCINWQYVKITPICGHLDTRMSMQRITMFPYNDVHMYIQERRVYSTVGTFCKHD
jgi:hypothetical protein